jgi:hypothetical protein
LIVMHIRTLMYSRKEGYYCKALALMLAVSEWTSTVGSSQIAPNCLYTFDQSPMGGMDGIGCHLGCTAFDCARLWL